MKTEITPPSPVTQDALDPTNSAPSPMSEKLEPVEREVDPIVKSGIEYLLHKNANLYRRLAK